MRYKTGFFSLLLFIFTSCSQSGSDGEDIYPNIITELCSIETNSQGILSRLHLDDGTSFYIAGNTSSSYRPNAFYRALASYTPVTESIVNLRSAQSALVLADSTQCAIEYEKEGIPVNDPVGLLSAWRTPQFINLHLATKTQNQAEHHWGYIMEEKTERHIHLRLFHRQMTDPTSFTTDTYASIQIQKVPDYTAGDTISFTLTTWDKEESTTLPPL